MSDNNLNDATVGGTPNLEVVAHLDDRPGNPALTPDGRLILSLHPFSYGEPSPYHVVEVMEDGSTRPFPNEDWSTAPDDKGVGISAVIGVQSGRRSVVWILDMGDDELLPKLVAWDTKREELHRIITIPPHARVPQLLPAGLRHRRGPWGHLYSGRRARRPLWAKQPGHRGSRSRYGLRMARAGGTP